MIQPGIGPVPDLRPATVDTVGGEMKINKIHIIMIIFLEKKEEISDVFLFSMKTLRSPTQKEL